MSHTGLMLRARRLGKRYGSRWLFADVDLDLAPGDVLAVTGPNGQGKSTLLKVLAGLTAPSRGEVDWSGSFSLAALDQSLYPLLTGPEHLDYFAALGGISPRFDLLERVGLGGAESTFAGQMSSGQRARLKLAMALQSRPDTLILDEPSASLDASGCALVQGIIQEQSTKGAVIVATNDPRDLEQATHELRLAG